MMSTLSKSFGLHKIVKQHYLSLAKGAECQVTYIWIDKAGENLLCKTRTLEMEPAGIKALFSWDFQGKQGNRSFKALGVKPREEERSRASGWMASETGEGPGPFGRAASEMGEGPGPLGRAALQTGVGPKPFRRTQGQPETLQDRPAPVQVRRPGKLPLRALRRPGKQRARLLGTLGRRLLKRLVGEFRWLPLRLRELYVPEWSASWPDEKITEVVLVPVRMFRDPFTLDPNKLVLCEVFDGNYAPTGIKLSNQRSQCVKVMENVKDFQPWFGMEQEYMLLGLDGKPFGWPSQGLPFTAGMTKNPCTVGINNMLGRDISISHYRACLYAGVNICGTNAEAFPTQWEFQVGPCEGIEVGDHVLMARYILHRICEDFGVVASLDATPIEEKKHTSGCHTNFSTKEMRSKGGLQYIEEAIARLSKRHSQHLRVYDPHGGADNMIRLTNQSTTSSFQSFSTATASRKVSVRIPDHVSRSGCGYFEDRRPAANCDPYCVMRALAETCLLGAAEDDDEGKKTTAA
ncbi:glutamine synthetase-like [Mastacembelus armatus]|uniref:glutamine synthetase-like n=1 Tax=Mastacembelus armatus TaxID=205130 RepID=UPI000E45B1BA|nr:glutamine synthetase-like [Mastacembelus armatus]